MSRLSLRLSFSFFNSLDLHTCYKIIVKGKNKQHKFLQGVEINNRLNPHHLFAKMILHASHVLVEKHLFPFWLRFSVSFFVNCKHLSYKSAKQKTLLVQQVSMSDSHLGCIIKYEMLECQWQQEYKPSNTRCSLLVRVCCWLYLPRWQAFYSSLSGLSQKPTFANSNTAWTWMTGLY